MRLKNFACRKSFFITACMVLLHFVCFATLNGNYTINPRIAASTSNYRNWASAVGDLLTGTRTDGGTAQGPGISGPVVFTVYDTVYANTQVRLTAITGTSFTNTITFRSTSDSSKCVLQFPSGSAISDDYVLMLDGADYISFQKIGFQRTGNGGCYSVVQILNDADRNSFIRCWLKTCKIPSNTAKGFTNGIGSVFYFKGNGDSTLISQNRIIYGYNGIYDSVACTGNMIFNNIIDTSGCSGTYMTQQTGLKIMGNTYNMGDFGSGQGHYVSYAIRIETSPSVVITKNKIFMLATNAQVVRAITLVSITSTAASPALMNNNWILNYGGTSSCSGLSLYGVTYLDLYYNNFLITSTVAASSVIHHNTTYTNTYVEVVNNNLINKGNGMIYDFPSTNGGLDTARNNNCYVAGTVFGKMNNVSYGTIAAWRTATGKDLNSMNIDPGYVSNTNLHVSNIGINARAIPYFRVSDDIDGETRDATTPDIGADEFFPIANDAGISSLDSPLVFCAGTRNVKITFQNYGYDTLKRLEIRWKINGITQTTYNWMGSVYPGGSSSSINLGSYTFSPNIPYNFIIWSNNPNNLTDGNKLNDTLKVTRYAGMSGTYTIGDTNISDFKSFNNAITAMTSRGICGAVTFNVYRGIYNEQITLAQLPGMGASNPVTFQSIDADSTRVTVRLPSSTATGNNNAAIQLAGADYVTFRRITFQRTGSYTISEVVHVLNESNNNTFTNCRMINIPITTSNATGINIWSDLSQDNNNVFRNNYVKFGTYNMSYMGTGTAHETGTIVEGNIFDSAYNNAVLIGYNDGIIVRNNIFRNSISRVSGNSDLQLGDCDSLIKVNSNFFYNLNTDNSIYLTGCNASSANPGITSNNAIVKNTLTGIYLDAVDNQNVVFNSIYFNGSGTTNGGIVTSSSTSTNIVLKNNNIVMTAGYVFFIYNSNQVSASNRNNLKAYGGQFAYWGGTNYYSLPSLVFATGKDLNSLSVDPLFTSSTNLHIKNPVLKKAGEPITGITSDFDGETRNSTTPDIGADEFNLVPNDAGMIAITSPRNIECEGQLPVRAVIRNYGRDTLRNATIYWSVNSVLQTPYSWSGKLPNFKNDTFFIGYYNFVGNTTPAIMVRSSSPNGQADGIIFNDTFIATRQIRSIPVANAGPDQNLCIGDSMQIGPAALTGYSYKWTTLSSTLIASTSKIYIKSTSPSTLILEVTDDITGCFDKDTMSFVLKAKPVTGFTVNNLLQCLNGNKFDFSDTTSGISTHFWNFGDKDTSTSVSPSHTYKIDDTFTVRLISANVYGCKDTAEKNVYVRPKPVSGFNINNLSQCLSGNSFLFTNTSTGQTLNNWDFGDTTFSVSPSPSPKTYLYPGTKSVKLTTNNNFGCKDSIIKTIDVRPQPVSGFTINKTGQCLNGNNFNFTNTSAGASSYLWNFGDANTSANVSPLHAYATAGSFNVKLISTTIYGCKDSTIKSVDVWPQPVAGFLINNNSQCLDGNNFDYTNTSSGASFYSWYFGDATSSTNTSPLHSYTSSGTFTVSLVAKSNFGCKDSTSSKVDVWPQPVAGFVVNDTSQCLEGNSFDFINTSSGAIKNNWEFGDGDTSASSSPTHVYIAAGVFDVMLVAKSFYGCKDSMTQQVTVKPMPVVYLGKDTTIYDTDSLILDAGSGFDSYLWSDNQVTSKIRVDSTIYGTGVKLFWVKVTRYGCDGFDTVQVTINKHTSIDDYPAGFELKIYPNPVNDLLYIEIGPVKDELVIILTNIQGKQLKSERIFKSNMPSVHRLDISGLSAGIYYLNISNSLANKVTKIVKF